MGKTRAEMSACHDELSACMRLANYRPASIACYTRCVQELARHHQHPPDQLNADEVRAFLLHRRDVDGVSLATQRIYTFAFRFFYGRMLGRRDVADALPIPRVRQKLPDAPTRHEVRQLLAAARTTRDHAFLSLAYATGLRVSELVSLQVQSIDAEAGLIRVVDGKGGKDRVVPLSPVLLHTLRRYWAEVRPARPWLFAGCDATRHLSIKSGQGIVRATARRAGLTRWISTHSLRHACATHMLEDGVDVRLVQQVLGHASLLTTARYLCVSVARLRHAEGPLDRLLAR